MLWVSTFIFLVPLWLVIIAAAILLWRVYSSQGIMDYSENTLISLYVGGLVCAAVAGAIWVLFYRFTSFVPISTLSVIARHFIGLALGITVGALLFRAGLFTIDPGERAYWELLQYPMGTLGVGKGWLPPLITQWHSMPIRNREESDERRQEYITGEGVELFVKSASTYRVFDPLLAQTIEESDIDEYVRERRRDAVRRFVNQQRVDNMELAYKEKPSLDDQLKLARMIRELKGDVSYNGPSHVQKMMNEQMAAKGVEVTEVQFSEVTFNEKLEQAAQLVFEQMLRSAGIAKDASNLVATADILAGNIDLLLKRFGIEGKQNLENPETREMILDILREAGNNLDRALSIDGRAGYQHFQFGGDQRNTGRVIVNPNPPTTPNPNPTH
jgi:regulator of protease activity HflC (stomatin/prohibitin superfamily)